ncbi:hypothetical protein C8R45DRAFT_928616 [Mycena sanguinolenta]|nr:hypothetical protein C8R45DRAFT_928616 [Mycena sanguinolenta]
MPSGLLPAYRFVPSLSSGIWMLPDPAITACHAFLGTSARDHVRRRSWNLFMSFLGSAHVLYNALGPSLVSVLPRSWSLGTHRVPRFTSYVASDILGDFPNYMTGGYRSRLTITLVPRDDCQSHLGGSRGSGGIKVAGYRAIKILVKSVNSISAISVPHSDSDYVPVPPVSDQTTIFEKLHRWYWLESNDFTSNWSDGLILHWLSSSSC